MQRYKTVSYTHLHAHIIMDGVNYRHAIDMHKNGLDDKIIREHLKAYIFGRLGEDYQELHRTDWSPLYNEAPVG